MLGEYIMDGFKVAIVVAAMLIGFVALIAMINGIFTAAIGVSFQDVLDMCLHHLLSLLVYLGVKRYKQEVLWRLKWYLTNL